MSNYKITNVWIWAVLISILVPVAAYFVFSEDTIFGDTVGWPLFVCLVISSFSSILISKIKNKWNGYLGYGLLIMFFLFAIYNLIDYYTCTGKLCQNIAIFFGFITGTIAVGFIIFYPLSLKARNQDSISE